MSNLNSAFVKHIIIEKEAVYKIKFAKVLRGKNIEKTFIDIQQNHVFSFIKQRDHQCWTSNKNDRLLIYQADQDVFRFIIEKVLRLSWIFADCLKFRQPIFSYFCSLRRELFNFLQARAIGVIPIKRATENWLAICWRVFNQWTVDANWKSFRIIFRKFWLQSFQIIRWLTLPRRHSLRTNFVKMRTILELTISLVLKNCTTCILKVGTIVFCLINY